MTWKIADSEALYLMPSWGDGYFGINSEGHVEVRSQPSSTTTPSETTTVDLYELIQQVQARGISAPILFRFDDILRARVRELSESFDRARQEYDYPAPYRCVYPIKVNQERHVVEAILDEGRKYGMGLEVGSKPELFAGIALQAGRGDLMICNGYKDSEYVEMALLASRVGVRAVLVIEKYSELDTILRASQELGIRPTVGVRTKLNSRGTGRWQSSSGDRSKFGLTSAEIVAVVDRLAEHDMLDCLALLHFHIGSQISHIRSIKNAMREATRTLVELSKLGVKIRWFDAGGGLGIDYDGSRSNFDSSRNYGLDEYAADIVSLLGEACQEAEIEAPTILTESGRALAAHHAVLVTEVIGVSRTSSADQPTPPAEDESEASQALAEMLPEISVKNYQEYYHDAQHLRDESMLLYNTGQLTLRQKACVELHFWRVLEKIQKITQRLDYVPDELDKLGRLLSDTYFLNFSLFQSVPDSWAISQLFPIVPLHRHDEQPDRRATLADLTCDSDGKVERFIDLRDVKHSLELHALRPDEPYFIGFFLVGAYQEILGDLHNLFGDTSIVHVDMRGRVSEPGEIERPPRPRLPHVLRGERVKDVLSYVEYDELELLRTMRGHLEEALEAGTIDYEESARLWRRFEDGLRGYTYLTRPSSREAAPSDRAPTGLTSSDKQETDREDSVRKARRAGIRDPR